ncbi:nucleolar protein 12-domain-containing protein [Daldinia loculata]|uniref:nucleolar protein 12-domain-containing protein n=1 Tax=Daldinia loculata TaxID=103429 RepID=UPI0020C4C5FF|nr:nucleolar protein 12-domain-containing protein [Daldinia loculata]KAI1647270.1 nucleolar protein 12-domain-containing protein [Daldinia loculata]
MFARPRPKKGLLVPPPKKRKAQHLIEEIKFDNDARSDYLTGFHKRKLQRIKNAQEQAAQRARQEKIEIRKKIREDRKREVEEHVQNVNAILKQAQEAGYVGGEEASNDEADEWGGFKDTPALEPVDHEEEYIDEERYTTVTIESVSVSKDGLSSTKPEDSGEEDQETAKQDSEHAPPGSKEKARPPKKKKPKFRYESKADRQLNQRKQKAAKIRKKPSG